HPRTLRPRLTRTTQSNQPTRRGVKIQEALSRFFTVRRAMRTLGPATATLRTVAPSAIPPPPEARLPPPRNASVARSAASPRRSEIGVPVLAFAGWVTALQRTAGVAPPTRAD